MTSYPRADSSLTAGEARQSQLEARLAERWQLNPAPDATVEEAFGAFETWVLPLGEHRLLLHPAHRQWFYLDRLHGTWEATGFGPGEVIFYVVESKLGCRRRALPPVTCPACGVTVPGGSRFCPKCGAPLAVARLRCAVCGADNEPDSRFCRQCGVPLAGARKIGEI
ncbi:MAG: zinc ribbon domain-containing protein [Anaerolineae bacterium]|nr:zinc ribbon domain-containing protein [Anaerolineae bacterium]